MSKLRDKIAFYDSAGRASDFWFFWLPVITAFTLAAALTVISVILGLTP